MTKEIYILILTAASIGFFHTLFGPDHYLPFIVISRAKKWSTSKTMFITFLCGIGHVGSSIILGLIGVSLGIAIKKLVAIESFRGSLAAWGLIAFGLVYFIYGIRKAIKNKPHVHAHFHKTGEAHKHTHTHNNEHVHVHEEQEKNITPWVLFTIFVLGPCEPLIPILMYPAARHNMFGLIMVTSVFSIITILTMSCIVLLSIRGLNWIPAKKMERYSTAMAGVAIFLSGLAIRFFGL